MAMSPAVAGAVAAWCGHGRSVASWWLVLCWLLCYCMQFSTARWLKSRGARRWLKQPVAYGVILCAVGLPFVIVHPVVLMWAPAMVMLAGISFAAAWARRERSLWSNAAVVCASCLMAALTFGYGYVGASGVPGVRGKGLLMGCAFGMAQFGSVLFVKTMIRERGSKAYLAASWAWHVIALAVAVCTGSMPLTALGLVLLARAIAVPIVAMHHVVRPLHTGLVEFATSMLTCVLIVVAAI